MTQFSVETLTVLIYVLVFRHFRTLGELSPRFVRARDALIAVGIGTFIGGLLLSVATTETAPRLREYFAEFGPTLGHGRNIVNVILVDFRAFDTLGEITVLATAAIGVRGLLRFGADGRIDHQPVQPVNSPIFRTAARLLMPLLLLFSVFLLFRGHNQPGGGFVGGLIAAAAFALSGAILAVLVAHLLGAESDLITGGLLGFSPVLTAIALGTVFYRPSIRVALLTALGTAMTVVAQVALNVALTPFAIPALTAPFVLVTWMFMAPRESFEPSANRRSRKAA